MSRLITALGILLLAIGGFVLVAGLAKPGMMQAYGASLDTAAIMLVGGVLAIGMGGLMNTVGGGAVAAASTQVADEPPVYHIPEEDESEAAPAAAEETPAAAEAAEPTTSRIRFTGFARKLAGGGAAAAAGAAATTAAAAESVQATTSSSVQDTIAALEKAKSDIKASVSGVAPPEEEVPAEEEYYDEEAVPGGDAELFVIEEREIRGHPARILSDNTVEAETAEGWMRFENLEHLNEYLDATEGA